jgi:hypothetical protein
MVKRINQPLAIKCFMEDNPLAAAFVLEAMMRYAQETIDAPDWKRESLISQDYWRDLARKALDVVYQAK